MTRDRLVLEIPVTGRSEYPLEAFEGLRSAVFNLDMATHRCSRRRLLVRTEAGPRRPDAEPTNTGPRDKAPT